MTGESFPNLARMKEQLRQCEAWDAARRRHSDVVETAAVWLTGTPPEVRRARLGGAPSSLADLRQVTDEDLAQRERYMASFERRNR